MSRFSFFASAVIALIMFTHLVYFGYSPKTIVAYRTSLVYALSTAVQPEQCFEPSYEELVKPCKNSLAWDSRINDTDLKTNLHSSNIFTFFNGAGNTSHLKIVTVDNLKRKKLRGGDSWWVKIMGPVSFHVDMLDNMDGTYEGVFNFIRAGNYTVSVNLLYSTCDGYRDPPDWWFKVGTDQGKFQKQGVLQGQEDYINQKKDYNVVIKPSRPFIDITATETKENYLNSACGYFEGNGYVSEKNNFTVARNCQRKIATIWFYGDSLQRRYKEYFSDRATCRDCFHCQLTYTWLYPNHHPTFRYYDDLAFNESRLLKGIRNVLNNAAMKQNSSIFLINFGLHALMSLQIEQAKNLFRNFLGLLKEMKLASPNRFPRIVWKTTTPSFQEDYFRKVNRGSHVDHIRFLNKQRVDLWNAFTRDELKKTDVKVLNMFYMAASYPPGPIDGVHFPDATFEASAEDLERYAFS